VWQDPLLRPPPPSGTASGAYVEQPEPRANPMTIEGEIAALGEMARGAVRRGGSSGVVARLLIVTALAAVLFSALYSAAQAFR
jgi:hypothetical protein